MTKLFRFMTDIFDTQTVNSTEKDSFSKNENDWIIVCSSLYFNFTALCSESKQK